MAAQRKNLTKIGKLGKNSAKYKKLGKKFVSKIRQKLGRVIKNSALAEFIRYYGTPARV
jgi:hypothetical protein